MEQEIKRIRELLNANAIDVSDHQEIEENIVAIEEELNRAEIREKKWEKSIDDLKEEKNKLIDIIEDDSPIRNLKNDLSYAREQIERLEKAFKIQSPIDEMKIEILKRLFKNLSITELEKLERSAQMSHKFAGKNYLNYAH